VNLSTLQDLSGSTNKQKASFKRQTKTALDELVKINFLESWTVEGDMVAVKRVPNSRLEAQQNEADKEKYKLDYYR
jgi:hypothetical protein